MRDYIRLLDQFYIPARYPDTPAGSLPEGEPSLEMAQKALEISLRICRCIQDHLSEPGS